MNFDLDELDLEIHECLEMNKKNINKERLQRIHKDCHVFYNSVNV